MLYVLIVRLAGSSHFGVLHGKNRMFFYGDFKESEGSFFKNQKMFYPEGLKRGLFDLTRLYEYKYGSASAGERKALEKEWCLIVGSARSGSIKPGI